MKNEKRKADALQPGTFGSSWKSSPYAQRFILENPQALLPAALEPCNRYVADFVGKANILSGEIVERADGRARVVLPSGVEVLVSEEGPDTRRKIEIVVRPEALGIGMAASPGDAALKARITHRTFLGDHTEYLLEAEGIGPVQVNLPRQAERASGRHEVGDEVHILWAAEAGRVLAAED